MASAKCRKHEADQWAHRVIQQMPQCRDFAAILFSGQKENRPPYCGLSHAASIAILDRLHRGVNVGDVTSLSTALTWIRQKAIYKFDPQFVDLLKQQPLTAPIPVTAILYGMPQPCFFVENAAVIRGIETYGFFVWLDYNEINEHPELELVYLAHTGNIIDVPIALHHELLNDCLNHLPQSELEDPDDPEFTPLYGEVLEAVNLVLYLCGNNMAPVEGVQRSVDQYGHPTTPYVWNVGVSIGDLIRENAEMVQPHGDWYVGTMNGVPDIRWGSPFEKAARKPKDILEFRRN